MMSSMSTLISNLFGIKDISGNQVNPATEEAQPLSAFGERLVVESTPQVQIKFPYGVNPTIGQILTNNASSSVTSTQGYASVLCAGSAEAFSQIRT